MHTGDNMLAIYASEKALRLAERLDEAAAASRAHGIFGRVFGRIGDSARARENLERSVELARESDPAEAIKALFALGYHLEVSDADYDGANASYAEALDLALETGDLPSQVELRAAIAQVNVYLGDWETAAAETEASLTLAERQGLDGKLCYPYSMRGVLLWHEGDYDGAAELLERAYDIAEQVGRSEVAFESMQALAVTLRDRGDFADADQMLARSLDLCERAGLVAQSVEATAARAVNAAIWGKAELATETAAEAAGLAERLRYPVGEAAALEARGAAAADADLLTEAEAAWRRLKRPVDAERCATLISALPSARQE
jgi:tetratricopeptide (TPR) repeat protein